VLKLVLPKGSLERATLDLFEAADLSVNRSSTVEYKESDVVATSSSSDLPHDRA
jgi:ATP phosphoribosyltransferase